MDFKKLNFFGLPFMTWREYLLSHCNFDWQITERIDLQEDPEPPVFFTRQYFKRDLMYTEEIEYDAKWGIVCWNEENPAVILDFEDPVNFYLIYQWDGKLLDLVYSDDKMCKYVSYPKPFLSRREVEEKIKLLTSEEVEDDFKRV